MQTATVLRLGVVFEWVFIALGIILSFMLESRLPEPLREWLAADLESDPEAREFIALALLIPASLCWLIGSVGLLFLKRWAAWLYLGAAVVTLPLDCLFGPTVEHAGAMLCFNVSLVLSGLVLGLAFFSPALRPPLSTSA
jgi:urea transporter